MAESRWAWALWNLGKSLG